MNDDLTARERARRADTAAVTGMAALDEHFGYPEWRAEIDLVALVMAAPCRCVLGMLFGSFDRGVIELELHDWQVIQQHGFDAGSGLRFCDLDAAWRRVLTRPADPLRETR